MIMMQLLNLQLAGDGISLPLKEKINNKGVLPDQQLHLDDQVESVAKRVFA